MNVIMNYLNPMSIRRYSLLIGVLFAVLACTPKPPTFTATDITGSNIGRAATPWVLYDAQNKAVQLDDFKGKVLVMFFGFTRCPDVCPTTLIDYAYALKALKQQKVDTSKVQVVFVTLDPQRDVFPVLQEFTAAFDTSFIALRGDDAATKTAADAFKIFHARNQTTPQDYSIDHTAASYIFDAKGRVRLFVRHGQNIDTLAQDLKQIIQTD